MIDLTDTRGNLQNLSLLSQYDLAQASHHLSEINRGEYVLLKIERKLVIRNDSKLNFVGLESDVSQSVKR